MRLLHYVLTASAILVAGTDGSTKTVDPKTEIVARPLSFDFLRVNKTPSVASSLPKQHPYDETSTNGDGHQENEERMFSDPAASKAVSKLVEATEDALVKTEETFKTIGEAMKGDNVAGQKRIMDQDKVLPLQHDELQAQKRLKKNAESSAAAMDTNLKGIGSEHWNVVPTSTDKLIEKLDTVITTTKIVEKGKIVNEDLFFQLLQAGFSSSRKSLNYDEIVKSLLKLDDDSLYRVNPTELMKAVYSLRSMKGMKAHADGMQRILADRFTGSLIETMFPLWLERKVSPVEVFKMLPTGYRTDYGAFDRAVAEGPFDRAYLPMCKYLDMYSEKFSDFPPGEESRLTQHHAEQYYELKFFDKSKSADNLPDRGWKPEVTRTT